MRHRLFLIPALFLITCNPGKQELHVVNNPLLVFNKTQPSIPGTFIHGAFSGIENIELNETLNKEFRLSYTSVGLGSNFTSMQPVFTVKGNRFIYTSEQTSFYEGRERKKPDTLLTGNFRTSSADSILDLVDKMTEPVVNKTNPGIMSGGIHYIHVSKEDIEIEFRLHNTSDKTAQRIVDILNNYIPPDMHGLWLFDIPDKPW